LKPFLTAFAAIVLVVFSESNAQEKAPEPNPAASAPPAGKLYVYKKSAGRRRELEVYFPPNHDPSKAKVPGLILFHGGGWTGGTLTQFRTACQYFASRGLVTATVEYQMLAKQDVKQLPKGESFKWVCITDAKSAIRWFKEHAGELGVDPQRIITGGGSAGGHIAVLATTNPGLNDPKDPEKIDTSVIAYLLFNSAFTQDDENDAEVYALKHVKKNLAPAAVFFGTKDTWLKGWDTLYAHLKVSGNTTTEVHLAEGQSHGIFNKDPWQTVTLIEADRFLVRQGLLKGEPTLKSPKTGEKLVIQSKPKSD
jgi:acetyl esterase